jgi:formylglycine-generating enzyme
MKRFVACGFVMVLCVFVLGALPASATSCGDGTCQWAEYHASACPADCQWLYDAPSVGYQCGNFICDPTETWSKCPQDCPHPADGVCNNGYCDWSEYYGSSCPADCLAKYGYNCGNNICDPTETVGSCPHDCVGVKPDVCPDSYCSLAEYDASSCIADCKVYKCGNGLCDATETVGNCPQDCVGVKPDVCPDTYCSLAEYQNSTCIADCKVYKCGNGLCDLTETVGSCPQDCVGKKPDVCPDTYCSVAEYQASSCIADCKVYKCGNGLCDATETVGNCPQDCVGKKPDVCPDTYCSLAEYQASSCIADCKIYKCNNGICDPPETVGSCPQDCVGVKPDFCPDGYCSVDEYQASSCIADCKVYKCGNGICDPTETVGSCPSDCVVPPGMALIPSGCFNMGDAFSEGNSLELPVHNVCITSDFCMDVNLVTNAEYAACVSGGGCTAPAYSSSLTRASYYGSPTYENFPVVWVSWNQARAYCTWAGKRLPKEAEWEYAARGGLSGKRYPWGDTISGENANFYQSGDPWDDDTSPLGYYAPNGYGVYDMSGNVWEWVNDWYSDTYYSTSPTNNPPGPITGANRVLRSGCYAYSPNNVRVSYRFSTYPTNQDQSIGFRCAGD